MSRIAKTFENLKHPALVTFITAGDPDAATAQDIMMALAENGADIIEIGMPFTDPMADGPVIQAAALRALEAGADMHGTLKMVQQFRSKNKTTPVLLMGYFNPVLAYGPQQFIKDAKDAGVDGLIIVDLPPEEDDVLRPLATQAGLDIIRLITPTTNEKRLPKVLKDASGFLYYVSVAGITGGASADIGAVRKHVEQIRQHTKLPICIGFGIKTPEDAKTMAAIGDGVVVGSAIVQTIADQKTKAVESVGKQVAALAQGMR